MFKQSLLAILMIVLGISATAAADEKGGEAMPPGPTVVHMAKDPITVGKGHFELLTIILDFPAGAGMANHKHGGNVLVTVLNGEITLREKGGERVVKTGESWTEKPGDIHAVVNAGTETARVVGSFLIPKGAEVTTMVK